MPTIRRATRPRARPRMVTSSLGVEETLTLKAASTHTLSLSLSLAHSLALSFSSGRGCMHTVAMENEEMRNFGEMHATDEDNLQMAAEHFSPLPTFLHFDCRCTCTPSLHRLFLGSFSFVCSSSLQSVEWMEERGEAGKGARSLPRISTDGEKEGGREGGSSCLSRPSLSCLGDK